VITDRDHGSDSTAGEGWSRCAKVVLRKIFGTNSVSLFEDKIHVVTITLKEADRAIVNESLLEESLK